MSTAAWLIYVRFLDRELWVVQSRCVSLSGYSMHHTAKVEVSKEAERFILEEHQDSH